MTLKSWLLVGVELLLSGIIIFVLLGQISEQRTRAEKAEQEVDGQRQVIATQAFNINRFNQIAQDNSNEKQQIQQRSEASVKYIREKISTDECAGRLVPVDAVNRLREHANKIRHSTDSTDSE